MVPGDGTEVLQKYGGYTYKQGELRERVGKERGGTDIPLYCLRDKGFFEPLCTQKIVSPAISDILILNAEIFIRFMTTCTW
jgi:hypothetical protein